MKIQPSLGYPKFSSLKKGDKVRIKDNAFTSKEDRYEGKWNGKIVTVLDIHSDIHNKRIKIREVDSWFWWMINRFEIDEN